MARLVAALAVVACVAIVMVAIALVSEYRRRPQLGMAEVIDPSETTYFAGLIAGAVKMSTDTRNAAAQAGRTEPYRRDVHSKSHGCLRATFEVLPVAETLRYGIFSKPASYRAWIRFSNGKTQPNPDKVKDARGMAIKVMGVEGPSLLGDASGGGTQDFIMINSTAFFIPTIQEYADFAQALSLGKDVAYFFGGGSADPRTWKLRQMYLALKTLKTAPDSLLNTQYHSLSAYKLGPAQYVKYGARPCRPRRNPSPDRSDPDFLRNTMNKELQSGGACFDLMVQVQAPGKNMPVEDTTVEWDEDDAPFVPVARVDIPAMQDLNDKKMLGFCENISFNPWHSLVDHQPVGVMNRARKALYLQDSRFRRCRNGVALAEPVPERNGVAWPMEFEGQPCAVTLPPATASQAGAGE